MLKKFWWCLFSWKEKYPSWEEVFSRIESGICKCGSGHFVIVTHDIGLCEGGEPGPGNRLLAESVERVHRRFPQIPVLPQIGVAKALSDNVRVSRVIGPPTEDTPTHKSTGEYNTWTVSNDQRDWCIKGGYWPAKALLVTTPDHAGRVIKVMKRQGFEDVVLLPLRYQAQKAFSSQDSLYRMVRWSAKWHPVFFRSREVCARFLFWTNGWI